VTVPDKSKLLKIVFTEQPVVLLLILFHFFVGGGNVYLLYYQIKIILKNLTTNELTNYHRYFGPTTKQKPENYGIYQNVKEFFFPTIDWKNKFD